jgi:hypothetical protein
VFLVGGSSRVPLAASLLHRALGIAPTVIEQPELVVAEGALHVFPAVRTAPAVETLAPVESPARAVAAPAALVSPTAPNRARWWLSATAAVAAAGLIVAAVVAINPANGDHRTATPPTSSSSRPPAGPALSPSTKPSKSSSVTTSATPSSVDEVTKAQQFIPRIPAQVRAMGCVAEVTGATPTPTVTCGDLAKTSVIYYVYSDAAGMNAEFAGNLDATPGGDCSKTPRLAVTTYSQGGHRGRLKCKAVSGSGLFSWTDDTTLVWGQIPPSDQMSYKKLYDLWTTAVQVAPAY